ncbi:MAG: hypothetical protein ACK57E_03725, partial [Erythrobacteraceae bacterium]
CATSQTFIKDNLLSGYRGFVNARPARQVRKRTAGRQVGARFIWFGQGDGDPEYAFDGNDRLACRSQNSRRGRA